MLPLLLPSWLDPDVMIKILGHWAVPGVCLVVFIECAIFPVLPGDSLLFSVGLLTAAGQMSTPLWANCLILTVFAILGNVAGYWVGRLLGPVIFRPRRGLAGRIFAPDRIVQGRALMDRYGGRALVLGRFVAFVRTFITWIAGATRMDFRHFIGYTAVGGVAWAGSLLVLGFFLGQISIIKNNIDVALLLLVVVTVVPMVIDFWRNQRKARHRAEAASTAPDDPPV